MKLKMLVLCLGLVPAIAMASSHREAPFISSMPQMDASDFYMFMSYETGRSGYVTLLANYDPLQDAYSGPNFHALNDSGVYDFHIDNTGTAKSNLTFRFKFTNTYKDLTVPVNGAPAVSVPLLNIGAISSSDQSALNRIETYTVQVQRGSNPRWENLSNSAGGSVTFTKPVDNIGNKSISNYAAYADSYVYTVNVPGCGSPGRVFVGQRKDGFVADLGDIFDLVNLNPLGARDSTKNALNDKNVTTLALELPVSCVRDAAQDPIIGGWTTSSTVRIEAVNSGHFPVAPGFSRTSVYTQVSRLGSPLVNELVIGLKDKDKFNGSDPSNDTQFLNYVTTPSLPVLLNALFGVKTPHTPRNDLVSVFLTGVSGLNQPLNVVPAEELRLNTSIAATAPAQQNDLGVIGGDAAGFPNGRRPYDDVVDIALRVVEGAVCSTAIGTCGDQTSDPNNGLPLTDGARAAGATAMTENVTGMEYASDTYLDHFPYLETPVAGSVSAAPAVLTSSSLKTLQRH